MNAQKWDLLFLIIFHFPNFLNTGVAFFWDVNKKGFKDLHLKIHILRSCLWFLRLGSLWVQFRQVIDFQIFRAFTKPVEAQTRFSVSFRSFRLIVFINSKLKYFGKLLFLKPLAFNEFHCPVQKLSGKIRLTPSFKFSWFLHNFLSIGQLSATTTTYKIQPTVEIVSNILSR